MGDTGGRFFSGRFSPGGFLPVVGQGLIDEKKEQFEMAAGRLILAGRHETGKPFMETIHQAFEFPLRLPQNLGIFRVRLVLDVEHRQPNVFENFTFRHGNDRPLSALILGAPMEPPVFLYRIYRLIATATVLRAGFSFHFLKKSSLRSILFRK